MRIGIELKHIDPQRGGAEAYTCQLAAWLVESGHEVHLFVYNVVAGLEGAVVHTVTPFSAAGIRRLSESVDIEFFIGTDRSTAMDLFHPHRGTIRGNLDREIARSGSRVVRGLARIASGVNPRYQRALILERRQIGNRTRGPLVVAVSEMIANEIRRNYSIPADRLRVIYNGVDCHRFTPEHCRERRQEERARLRIGEDEVCFLLVGNDFRRKGVAHFIRATALALKQEPSIRAVVVGRQDPQPYERLAAEVGCGECVSVVPQMADVRAAYAAADVFVLPTWYDPCSLTVLEAWACGLPVITTQFNGAAELMQDGKEGYIIGEPRDVNTLAERMLQLTRRDLRLSMGALGRSLAERHPLEKTFRQLLQIALEAVGQMQS